jgi:hypothetical protein
MNANAKPTIVFEEVEYIPQTIRITPQQYKDTIANKLGSLMFPNELYDATHYVDKKELRKTINKLNWDIPKGARVKAVLLQTTQHPNFKNFQNLNITYEVPLCASANQDGAYQKEGFTVSNHPVGDVYIVI